MLKNSSLIIFILASLALLIVVLRLWRKRNSRDRLAQDRTGLWRYHRDTEFVARSAFAKDLDKKAKVPAEPPKPILVLSFDGDVRAKQHRAFANLIDEVEINKDEISEVVVVLTSHGGMVSQYGHAFAEMERVRNLEIPLTVCVDIAAASGGYLMALPAKTIVAAPFAVVGSFGLVAFVPNMRRLLQNWDIAPRTFTAGKYKRTVTLTDDATPEEIARFQNELETIHRLFVEIVKKYRPQAVLDEIETGAHWTARESQEKQLGLVDEIGTSSEYLLRKNQNCDLIFASQKKSIWEDGISWFVESAVGQVAKVAFGFMPT